MRKFALLSFLLLLFSCSDVVVERKNLVDEDTMAALIAEFAINDQLGILNQNGSIEVSSKYILDNAKVKGKDFSESYTYYMSKPKTLKSIFNKAQDIIKEKDPAAKDFIEKKVKNENIILPDTKLDK